MNRTSLFVALLAQAATAVAADISVSGTWLRTVDKNDLVAGTGTDLIHTIESSSAVATLAITNTGGAGWRVQVARANATNWPPGVDIAVRRSGNESGVSGGTAYLTLADAAETFFEGTGDHASIEIQLRVDGMTVHTPPAPYSLLITYTIVPSIS